MAWKTIIFFSAFFYKKRTFHANWIWLNKSQLLLKKKNSKWFTIVWLRKRTLYGLDTQSQTRITCAILTTHLLTPLRAQSSLFYIYVISWCRTGSAWLRTINSTPNGPARARRLQGFINAPGLVEVSWYICGVTDSSKSPALMVVHLLAYLGVHSVNGFYFSGG